MNNNDSNNFSLKDIMTKEEKENFDLLVNYLCSKPVYNYDLSKVNRYEPEEEIKLEDNDFYDCFKNVSRVIFDENNLKTALTVVNNRTQIKDADYYYGFAKIYDINDLTLLEIEGMHTYAAVSGLIHELTHIIQALNENNPPKQYNEILSIFSEMIAIEYFSKIIDNQDIFDNHFINRIINRMTKRVYTSNLYDENDSKSWLKEIYHSNYTYFLGLIYSLRLFELYKQDTKSILDEFNMILSSEYSIIELLNKHSINLCNKETLVCFRSACDYYEQKIFEKYNKNEVHYVK